MPRIRAATPGPPGEIHARTEMVACRARRHVRVDRIRPAGEAHVLESLGRREDQARLRRGGDPALRIGASEREDRGDVVREERALRGTQDGAPRGHRSGHLLRRAGSGRVHGERAAARSLAAQVVGHRAVGEGDLDVQGEAVRPAAGSMDDRALLQQEDARGSGCDGAGEPAAFGERVHRPRQEGAREEHHACTRRS